MQTDPSHAVTRLAPGAVLRIADGPGRTVAVFQGLLWITQQEDPRDTLLGAGETFQLDRPGMAVAQALQDSRIAVLAAAEENPA